MPRNAYYEDEVTRACLGVVSTQITSEHPGIRGTHKDFKTKYKKTYVKLIYQDQITRKRNIRTSPTCYYIPTQKFDFQTISLLTR